MSCTPLLTAVCSKTVAARCFHIVAAFCSPPDSNALLLVRQCKSATSSLSCTQMTTLHDSPPSVVSRPRVVYVVLARDKVASLGSITNNSVKQILFGRKKLIAFLESGGSSPRSQQSVIWKHNCFTEVYLMAKWTTTCFGPYWPSSGCLNLLAPELFF